MRKKHIFIIIFLIFLLVISLLIFFKFNNKRVFKEATVKSYIASDNNETALYDEEYNKISSITRGVKVDVFSSVIETDEHSYKKIKYEDKYYLVNTNNLVMDEKKVVLENKRYVRTNATIYKDSNSEKILSHVKKGEEVEVIGYDFITEDGSVNKYKIKYKDFKGYIYSKYLVETEKESKLVYNENGINEYMQKMGNTLGGGTATNLDFYPYEKPTFENNVMPTEVRALYINSTAVKNIDKYIEFAKENNINAFVVDIKDNTTPAYNSKVMKEYSITNYENAINSYDDYKGYIKKAKEAGIYLIGRITVFKDSYFVNDHKEVAIVNKNNEPFSHNGSYWPSAFNRYVWEFNVSLAREAVTEIGFNEIQFDYVRFPDRTINLEKNGIINLNNIYNEEKSQAIQGFVMYACDSIHEVGAYVSIDVFGESANNYVTAYGQFWPAISNVADVISGMPYPDHFSAHEYGISEVVWTVPYKVLYKWGSYVKEKQDILPTPAVVRTWLQTYNATRSPYVVYDSEKVSDQIKALYDNGLKGGYMTWNSALNLLKYKDVSFAFRKVYE